MKRKKINPRSGSTLEEVLKVEGQYEECQTDAIKKVLAYKLSKTMEQKNLSKASMASRMETSRSQLDRLLDPENESVTLHTMKRAAEALGLKLELQLR
ncbi:helix-turn-helix domain-containing protein [Candidatus Nitrospira salsa]